MGAVEQMQMGCIRLTTLSVHVLGGLLEGSTLPGFVRGKGFPTQLPLVYMFVLQPSTDRLVEPHCESPLTYNPVSVNFWFCLRSLEISIPHLAFSEL